MTTDGRGVVDLGDLGLGVTVDATVAWGPPGPPTAYGAAACVRALPVDDRGPAFLRALIENGRLDLAGIEPGRYRLQRFLPQFFVGTWGLLGPTVGQPVTVVVGADGKVVPPYVD